MPRHTQPPSPTLFDSEYDKAVRDMIALFEQQLKTASTPLERAELHLAIKSWTAALLPPEPPKSPRAHARGGRRTKSAK